MAAPPPPKGVYGTGRFKVVTAQEAASLAAQDSREAHFPARAAVLESSNNAEQNCTLRLIGAMLAQEQHRPDPPPPRAAACWGRGAAISADLTRCTFVMTQWCPPAVAPRCGQDWTVVPGWWCNSCQATYFLAAARVVTQTSCWLHLGLRALASGVGSRNRAASIFLSAQSSPPGHRWGGGRTQNTSLLTPNPWYPLPWPVPPTPPPCWTCCTFRGHKDHSLLSEPMTPGS